MKNVCNFELIKINNKKKKKLLKFHPDVDPEIKVQNQISKWNKLL